MGNNSWGRMGLIVLMGICAMQLNARTAWGLDMMYIADSHTEPGAVNKDYLKIDTWNNANTNPIVVEFEDNISMNDPGGDPNSGRIHIIARGEDAIPSNRDDKIWFKGTVSAKNLNINASNSQIIFDQAVTVTEGIHHDDSYLESMEIGVQYKNSTNYGENSPRTWFKSTISAGWMDVGPGFGLNQFDGDITLVGHTTDPDYVDGPYSLGVVGGVTNPNEGNKHTKTIFNGSVTAIENSANTNVLIGTLSGSRSTVVFNNQLNAGSLASIYLGAAEKELSGALHGETTVVLGSSASHLEAANIFVANKTTLSLQANAAMTGATVFKNGSILDTGLNTLSINGSTTIEQGARVSFSGLTPEQVAGKTILTSTGGINGTFLSKPLYNFNYTGNSIEVAGIRRTSEAMGDVVGQRAYSKNNMRVATLYDTIMNDATVSDGVRSGMLSALEQSLDLAENNGAAGNAAFNQLFGLDAIHSTVAARTTGQRFFGEVSGRLSRLRNNPAMVDSGVQSDSAYANPEFGCYQEKSSRIWAGGFGAWTRQDDKGGDYGYKYNSGGFILGYDYRIGNLTFGFSGAYSNGSFKDNDGLSKTDVDTMNLGLYGSYDPDCGFYADVNLGYGQTWNKDKSSFSFGGGMVSTNGKFRNYAFQAGTHIGYAFKVPGEVRIVPTVGVEYMHIHQKAWNEKASNPAFSHWYGSSNTNYVEIPVGAKIGRTWRLGGGASITPEIRGAWIYEANNPDTELQMGFMGSSSSTTIYGINSGRSRGLVGAGIKANFNSYVDAFVDYSFEFRSGYKNHNVMAGLGVSF